MAVSWGSEQSATQLTGVTTETDFSTKPQLAANERCEVEITGNSNGTTDSLLIKVYTTLDGTNYTTVPIMELELDCTDGNDNVVSFDVFGPYQFKVSVQRSGSTDTFTADMNYRIATMS